MISAGIVLAGGRSSRMGTAKADLEWHGSTLLRRITGLLARSVDGPVLVVRAPGQPLPALQPQVRIVDDPRPHQGPVVGLGAGLRAAAELGAEVAFCCATDLPFLHPEYVRRVLAELSGATQVALPFLDGYPQPLAAAYRTELGAELAAMADAGEFRLRELFRRARVRELTAQELLADARLAAVDPRLASVRNINSPEDYRNARAEPAPEVRNRHRTIRAATLGAAAPAPGSRLNGGPLPEDPEFPLVKGDVLTGPGSGSRSTASPA